MPPIRSVSERGLVWMGMLDGGFRLNAGRAFPSTPYIISSGLAFYSPGHLVVKSHKLEVRMHAVEMLRKHLAVYIGTVHAYTKTGVQHEFDALVSFAYSIGERPFIESPVLQRIRTKSTKMAVAEAMGFHIYEIDLDGQPIARADLHARRRCETYLYINGLYRTS